MSKTQLQATVDRIKTACKQIEQNLPNPNNSNHHNLGADAKKALCLELQDIILDMSACVETPCAEDKSK